MKKKYIQPIAEIIADIESDTILGSQNDEADAKEMHFDYEDMESNPATTNSTEYEYVWDED